MYRSGPCAPTDSSRMHSACPRGPKILPYILWFSGGVVRGSVVSPLPSLFLNLPCRCLLESLRRTPWCPVRQTCLYLKPFLTSCRLACLPFLSTFTFSYCLCHLPFLVCANCSYFVCSNAMYFFVCVDLKYVWEPRDTLY